MTNHRNQLLVFLVALCGFSCNTRKELNSSAAMEPTIKKNSMLEIETKAYRSSRPKRWDVVAFKPPIGYEGAWWISRVVGMPGEVIDLTQSGLMIDGKIEYAPSHLRGITYTQASVNKMSVLPIPIKLPYRISSDSYFLMGDNVSNSLDSRYWGSLNTSMIIGRVK